MKMTRLLCILLLLVLILSGCGTSEPEQPEDNEFVPLPEIYTHEGSSIKDSPFVGTFFCSWSALEHSGTDDPSWEGRISTLACSEDGSFVLSFDSLSSAGTVTVKGTFTVDNDTATFTVKERSAEEYLGSALETFEMKVIDSEELRYRGGQQGLVADRDIFSKRG